jgi:hypothetical protein
MKKLTAIILTTFIFSCAKEEVDIYSFPTAIFFQDEQKGNEVYKYKYTLIKYNNFWFLKHNEKTTTLLKFDVYTNQAKPVGKWITYPEWMQNPSILTFDNNTIDSVTNMRQTDISETKLNNLKTN